MSYEKKVAGKSRAEESKELNISLSYQIDSDINEDGAFCTLIFIAKI